MTVTTEKENEKANNNFRTSVRQPIKWANTFLLALIHSLAVYGVIHTRDAKWQTVLFTCIYGYMGGFGVTGGAHRLWTHRSYKAKLPLRVILMILYVSTGMGFLFSNRTTIAGVMEANVSGQNTVDNERMHLHVNMPIKWRNVVVLVVVHAMALYGLVLFPLAHWKTLLFNLFYIYLGGFGVTGGAHRLWTHRSYKAKLPLRIILMVTYMSAGMNPIFEWVRDHRVHHKYSETDADPHNAKRGIFFSHVGWLMVKKHPDVLRRGRQTDMTDIVTDCVVAFQQKFYTPMLIVLCFVLPVFIPCYYWCESFKISWFINVFRWVLLMNCVWSVNSFAHTYGYRPYNRNIQSAENLLVSIFGMGEGWHNYHHTFPWDYKVAEFGIYRVNITTALIDMFAVVGWAYDLKQPSRKIIKECVRKSGDGSYGTGIWGHMKEVPEEVQNEEDIQSL